MYKFFLFFIFSPVLLLTQTLYNPQDLYDDYGGLFEKDSLRNLYIEFYDPNYHSVLVNSFFNNPSYRIPAKIILNGIVHDSAGVRYKGNSTFCLPNDNGNPKVPFNIDMNYWISGQKLLEYKKLKLANAWMDPTFAKEFSSAQIYKNYLPSPEVNLIKLHCQGNYLGLYVNTESINKQFLDKHFGEKDGVLFKCDPSGMFCAPTGTPGGGTPDLKWLGIDSSLYYDSYTIKSDYGWSELLDLIYHINNQFNEIDSVLNVDRVLWAFAVNQVTQNLDTYNGYYVHNYYLYKTEDGLFQMIPWDLDNSFIGAILGWDFWNPTGVYQFDPYFFGQSASSRPLAYNLLNDPLYRKQYTAHLRTIINESLDTAVIRDKVNQLQSLTYNAAVNDQHKGFSMVQYYENVESAIWSGWGFGGIMSTIDERKQYLLSHPEISLTPPSLSALSVSSFNHVVTINASNVNSVELMATTSQYNSKFKSFYMYDNGTNGDIIANDGIYSTIMPFINSGEIKFYIRAQNNDAIMLHPERAEYEFYIYKPAHNNSIIEVLDMKRLIRIIDILGRDVVDLNSTKDNVLLFYIYSDGTVEKRYKLH